MEYVVHNQMCDECHRQEAKDYWRAVVQVRQKVGIIFIISIHNYASKVHFNNALAPINHLTYLGVACFSLQ